MSYAALERVIKSLPEDYLDEIASYIEYVVFRHNKAAENSSSDLSPYFGSVHFEQDGLALQREMRDEWN